MDFLELAKNRFSLRKFSDKKVEKEKIDYILAAMQAAPTAVNFQPQRILVLTDEKELEKVSKCTKFAFNPPLNFLVCYDKETSWTRGNDGHDEGEIDAAIVATHMMLAAKSIGLGTTWVGSFNPKDVKEQFNLPENYVLVSMKCRMLDNMLWMDKLKSEMKKLYLECVALPMPTGIEFKHNFDFSITTPLPPLDWYALIKYAKGYIGENMHPIVVALHNAVPCFCFDTYGVLKYARCVCVEESSKIYDIMSRFSLLDNRINAYSRFWKCPPVDIVINRILHFDVIACQKTALNYYNNYEQMMSSILEVFKSK